MADVERYVRGSQTIIKVPVASATVIEKGDFVCIVSGAAVAAGGVADAGDAAANREAVADAFAGIAQSASDNGETDPVLVDISLESIHNLDLQAAAALSVGDLVEIYADTAAADDDTSVAGTTSPVAVCVEDKGATGTTFKAKLVPQKIFNTPQA
jgi:hypothetical protein